MSIIQKMGEPPRVWLFGGVGNYYVRVVKMRRQFFPKPAFTRYPDNAKNHNKTYLNNK